MSLVPENFIYYGTYEYFKSKLMKSYRRVSGIEEGKESSLNHALINFVSGATAEVASACVWMPTDIVSQKLQVQGPLKQKVYLNAFDCVRKTYATEGVKGFYRGIGATLMTYVPSGAATWVSYEFLKEYFYRLFSHFFPSHFNSADQSHLIHILAGAGSGVCSGIVANPFDIAKTRLQVQYSLILHSNTTLSPSSTIQSNNTPSLTIQSNNTPSLTIQSNNTPSLTIQSNNTPSSTIQPSSSS